MSAALPNDTIINGTNIELNLAVEKLSGLSLKELHKLVKEFDNFTIHTDAEDGASIQIDVERLASFLPLHLLAVLLSANGDAHLKHILCGIRLLHTLSDLASRHSRLEQILLDDVKFTEQVLDLVFYNLIFLGGYDLVYGLRLSSLPLLHPVLVACTLHLLGGYISTQLPDLVPVLLAHPKVDIFIDASFDSVHVDIKLLGLILLRLNDSVLGDKSCFPASERTARYFCQQCEASLQFLLSLCQQKLFRERLLKNKDFNKNGVILSLAHSILTIRLPDCFKDSVSIAAALSRLKGKILSILLQVCEAENTSYLDEVASSPKTLGVAKFVALEILDLLKAAFGKDAEQIGDKSVPKGLVLLNSMRLADIFSDDSNFRSFFMINIVQVLVQILAIPHKTFVAIWCSINIPMAEEDANIEFDPFSVAGVALSCLVAVNACAAPLPVLPNEINPSTSSTNTTTLVSYAQHRTSYLVKIIANLHCFVPNICEEQERDLFLNKFHECLIKGSPEPSSGHSSSTSSQKAAMICENLGSLSDYATSLTPNMLNDEDVQLLCVFSKQLQSLFPQQFRGPSTPEPCIKEECVEDSKPEHSYDMPQPQSAWDTFKPSNISKSDQDDQSTGQGAPLVPESQGPCHLEEASKFEDRGTSSCHDLDQVFVTGNVGDLSDNDRSDINATKNAISSTWNPCVSVQGVEADAQNSELNLEMDYGDRSSVHASSRGDLFRFGEYAKEGVSQDDDRAENPHGEEKQPRKRKRNIMNEMQITMIEKVLLDEPEMQRNQVMLQSWAEKLSTHGSEVTPSQLKNWLNNRKARLARVARESRPLSDGDGAYSDKAEVSIAQFYDSPDSNGEEYYPPPSRTMELKMHPKSGSATSESADGVVAGFGSFAPQQHGNPQSHHTRPRTAPSSSETG